MTDLSPPNEITNNNVQDINITPAINDNLSDIDKSIINSITNTSDIEHEGIDFKNIWDIINPQSSEKYVYSLHYIIKNLSCDMYKLSKIKLIKIIAKFFYSYETTEKYVSSSFISENIDFLIEEKLFYNYFLREIVNNKKYIDYFEFKAEKKHYSFYIEAIHKMKLDIDELYAFINNSQYTIAKTSDFRPFVNFIDIMHVFGTQLDIETKDEFYSQMKHLIINTASYMHANILTNKEHIKIYSLIEKSNNYSKTEIEKQIKYMEEDTTIYINWIKTILSNKEFSKYLCNLHKTTLDNYENSILDLIHIISHEWFVDLPNIDDYRMLFNNISRNDINTLLESEKINIHALTRFVTDSGKKIFYNTKSIQNLIYIYNKLENYGETSGFYEKKLTRDHIIYILTDCIYETSKQFISNIILDEDVKSCKMIDKKLENNNIKAYLDSTLTNIPEDILTKFFILVSSDLSSIMEAIFVDTSMFSNIVKNTTACNNIYKCLHYYSVISFIINKFSTNELLISKISELYQCIFKNIYKKRIFRDIQELKQSGLGFSQTSNELTIIIENFLKMVYNDINVIMNGNIYLDNLCANEELYPRKEFDNLRELIGFFEINEEETVKSVTDKIILNCDRHIYEYSNKCDKYSMDIPDEFLDPIYCSPIIEPLELPETKTIVDKKVILNHLYFKPTNPFNGLSLTREDLLEYNDNEDVKSRLIIFQNKFSNWKSKYKI